MEYIDNDNETKKEQQQEVYEIWNPKYKLPESSEFCKFSKDVYENSKKSDACEITTATLWRLLNRVRGNWDDGFYGELYLNTENNYFLLAIKATVGEKSSAVSFITRVLGNIEEIDSAFTFGENVRKLISAFKSNKCKPMLLITGQSYGGFLAQVVTYTIIYFYEEKGKVISRNKSSDDFGIYTMVFDSPAVYKTLCSIEPRDPLDMKRFNLPIVNFSKSSSISNKSHIHLGHLRDISEINEVDNSMSKQDKETVNCKNSEIQSLFFSRKNFELLHKFLFLAPMCAELVDKLPTFTLSNSRIFLFDEKVSPEEFIARAHHFLSQYKQQLNKGEFNGKQIFDMAVYKMWKAEMLKQFHNFQFNENLKKDFQELKDGTRIGGFQSFEELRFLGCLIHNSIPSCFHYDYNQFITIAQAQLQNFAATTDVTLVLMVKEKHLKIPSRQKSMVRIIYLVLDADAEVNVSLKLRALDKVSQNLLKATKLVFMGNKVTALDIFGYQLLHEVPVYKILKFHKEKVLKNVLFYCNQAISNESNNEKFESATVFAKKIINEDIQCGLISSDAGMGKSTALKQIALTLQDEYQKYWIVHLNLFFCQAELQTAKDALISNETAIELLRSLVLKSQDVDDVLKKIFDWKLKTKEMVLLLDSLDKICPLHRKTADNFIKLLSESKLKVLVATRTHEGKNFKDAKVLKLEYLDSENKRAEFIEQRFKQLGMTGPADPIAWLNEISGRIDSNFWRVPISLEMIVSIYGADTQMKARSFSQQKTHIYEAFLQKSIEDTLVLKIGIDKNIASSNDDYEEKIKNYNKLIEILAICTIFYSGQVTQEFQKKIEKKGEFINRFVVAKVENDCKKITFQHRSYAEYLVARVFVQQLMSKTQKVTLNNEQLRIILMNRRYAEIRTHICGILSTKPTLKKQMQLDIINGEEKEFFVDLVENNLCQLYLLLQDSLCELVYTQPGADEGQKIINLYLALRNAKKCN